MFLDDDEGEDLTPTQRAIVAVLVLLAAQALLAMAWMELTW